MTSQLGVSTHDAVYAQGPWEHRHISANGARFHVAVAGEGPLVVLLHGFPMMWWTWRRQLRDLPSRGFQVAAMDLRGYAGSDHPPRGYDLAGLAEDVAGVIRGLGHSRAHVVGHDVGGLITWTLAALQPACVDRAVVLAASHPVPFRSALFRDSGQRSGSSHYFGLQRPWVPERQLTRDDAAAVERILREWSATPGRPSEDAIERYRAAWLVSHTAHCAAEFFRWSVRSLPRTDGRRFTARMSAARVSRPILQIHGGADRTVLPRVAERARDFVDADYEWLVLPGVGHLPQEEVPDSVGSTIEQWLLAP